MIQSVFGEFPADLFAIKFLLLWHKISIRYQHAKLNIKTFLLLDIEWKQPPKNGSVFELNQHNELFFIKFRL